MGPAELIAGMELSLERRFVVDLVDQCLQPTPSEPGWEWAAKNVWLDEKQSATPKFYDPELTPWAKEWHQLPLDPETREVVIMKSSRSGATEAWLNVLRWMPEHWPGNALFAINSEKKAREVSKKRILTHLERTAGAQLPDKADDLATLLISLKNMDIVVSGSGSSGPFMEAWYRLVLLDELENHEQPQETTTYDRAKSRQATVPDGKLVAMSKPEMAGGIIDLNYIRGTQEKWLVPCPRCERRIELLFKFLQFSHCKELLDWNMDRVLKETYYQCQECGGKIESHEKRAMINEGLWVPTPQADRRRPPSGNAVSAEPGVRSFHISDLYSLLETITWGFLAKEYLGAYVVEPTESRQKYFRTNHEGLPWESQDLQINEDAILALRGGIVEERDGRREVIGQPFELCYDFDGKFQAEIPFRPKLLTLTADRQQTEFKGFVFAWRGDRQAFLIDIFRCGNDDESLLSYFRRPYYVEGFSSEPVYIFSGLVDCGDQTHEVYRLCFKAQDQGIELHPARGNPGHGELLRKTMCYRVDYCDQREIVVRDFFDHRIKADFYIGKIAKRADPRLWLPKNFPNEVAAELRAEPLVTKNINNRLKQVFENIRSKHGPNDWGDAGKMQYVIDQEIGQDLANLPDLPVIALPAGGSEGDRESGESGESF